MTGITEFSLSTPRVTILFLAFVVFAGVFLYLDYPKSEDPSIVIREAVVTAAFPGMSTERVENLITRKLEEKVREIPEVDEIKSDSKIGVSIVHVIVKDQYTDLEPIWQDLRNKMAEVAAELPDGTQGPYVNDEFGLTAVATIALWADGFSLREMRDVARDTRDRLYSVTGVKKIELYGIQDEQVYLELSNAKMAQFGISPGVVVDTLQRQNIILPGGKVNADGRDIVIEPSGNFNAVSEIESVIIPIPGTDKVTPLRDLTEIKRDYVDPPISPVFYNGRPAIVLSVSTLDGVNAVEFGERLTRRLEQIEQSLPLGYVLDYATYQPPLIEQAVTGAINNVFQSLGIVLLVVMVFLGLRTGLIVGSFVPMAMLLGLIGMSMLDVEMQRISIASMIIALGMLVDNGIVVAEDIRARLEAGQDRRQAAIAAGNSLSVPLLTSTLTTILAFLPIVLAEGGTGEYTLSLGQVMSIVLLGSWFLAMYMTPVFCVWFMKVTPHASGDAETAVNPYRGRFYRTYRQLLESALRFRFSVLALVAVAMVVAGAGFRFVTKEFFPASDRNQFLVYLDLPAGAHIDMTTAAVLRLSDWLTDESVNPAVTSAIAYVGNGGPRFFLSLAPLDPDPHIAFLVVNTGSSAQVPEMVRKTRDFLTNSVPEGVGRAKAMWLGASESGLVEVRLIGPDAATLMERAQFLMQGMRSIRARSTSSRIGRTRS